MERKRGRRKAGGVEVRAGQPPWWCDHKAIMSMVVTNALLFAALYVLLTSVNTEEVLKWAIGIIGTVVGFWLRGVVRS